METGCCCVPLMVHLKGECYEWIQWLKIGFIHSLNSSYLFQHLQGFSLLSSHRQTHHLQGRDSWSHTWSERDEQWSSVTLTVQKRGVHRLLVFILVVCLRLRTPETITRLLMRSKCDYSNLCRKWKVECNTNLIQHRSVTQRKPCYFYIKYFLWALMSFCYL